VIADRWTGVSCNETKLDAPIIEELDNITAALDAKARTLVTLDGKNGAYLYIGGGAGRYVTYASIKAQQLWKLLSDNADAETVLLFATDAYFF
jgi:hypothetical protein